MSAPVWDKIVGTLANIFSLGTAKTHGLSVDGDDLRFWDNQAANQYPGWTLTQLVGGGAFQFTPTVVPTGETWTVPDTYQYIVFEEVTIDGDLVVDGELVVFH